MLANTVSRCGSTCPQAVCQKAATSTAIRVGMVPFFMEKPSCRPGDPAAGGPDARRFHSGTGGTIP